MGNVTKEFGIWTPDDENAVEPDVYLSQMADSIENGLGKRVLKQEQHAYIRTQLDGGLFTLPRTHELLRLPIYKERGTGIELNANIVKIVTDGLYFIAPTVEAGFADNLPLDVVLRLNGDSLENPHTVASSASYTTVVMPTVIPLVAGDQLWLEARVGAPDQTYTSDITIRKARLHLAMLYAS